MGYRALLLYPTGDTKYYFPNKVLAIPNLYVVFIQVLSGWCIQNNFSFFTFYNSEYWYCFAEQVSSGMQLYSTLNDHQLLSAASNYVFALSGVIHS